MGIFSFQTFEAALDASFDGREVKRGRDYRQSLVDMVGCLQSGDVNPEYILLLRQLSEINEISYADEKDRSMQKVFRLHTVTFLHTMLVKKLLHPPKKLTSRKLFGQYELELVRDAPIQYRIMALSSSNTENEERAFTFMKDVAKKCTNHHPQNVISTCLIRSQVREDWKKHLGGAKSTTQRNNISLHGDKLKQERVNTVVPFSLLQEHPADWQAFLEIVSDFMSHHCWKEVREGIELFDVTSEVDYPPIHHFRSSSIKNEYK